MSELQGHNIIGLLGTPHDFPYKKRPLSSQGNTTRGTITGAHLHVAIGWHMLGDGNIIHVLWPVLL